STGLLYLDLIGADFPGDADRSPSRHVAGVVFGGGALLQISATRGVPAHQSIVCNRAVRLPVDIHGVRVTSREIRQRIMADAGWVDGDGVRTHRDGRTAADVERAVRRQVPAASQAVASGERTRRRDQA